MTKKRKRVMFHITREDQVPAILRDGLLPRRPTLANDGPTGVYLLGSWRRVPMYRLQMSLHGARSAVIEVDVTGLELVDRGGGEYLSPVRIKRKRLELVT